MRMLFVALIATVVAAAPASAASFTKYTPEAFERAMNSGKPILVHVHADWCPVCRRQTPILDSLLEEPELRDVEAIRINFDVDRDIVARLGVRSQSTVLIIKNGRITSASSYQTDAATLRREILSGL